MQAIARVNRVFKDKPGGLIVDYLGIGTDLKKALSFYGEAGGKGDPAENIDKAFEIFKEKLESIDWQYEQWRRHSRAYRSNDTIRLELIHVDATDSEPKSFALRILAKNKDMNLPPDFEPAPAAYQLKDYEITGGWESCGFRLLEAPYTPDSVAEASQQTWENLQT